MVFLNQPQTAAAEGFPFFVCPTPCVVKPSSFLRGACRAQGVGTHKHSQGQDYVSISFTGLDDIVVCSPLSSLYRLLTFSLLLFSFCRSLRSLYPLHSVAHLKVGVGLGVRPQSMLIS